MNALQTATAVRARQFEPLPTPFTDHGGEPVGMGRVIAAGDLRGLDRFAALGGTALREATAGRLARRARLVIGLPPGALAGRAELTPSAVVESITRAAGVPALADDAIIVRGTHAVFGAVLARARDLLYEGAQEVICGAVDTAYEEGFLRALDQRGRLLTMARDGGRIPSEAAAFVRLERRAPRGSSPACELLAVELSDEGMPGEVGRLLRRIAPRQRPIQWLLSDLNGERDRAEAWLEDERVAAEVVAGASHEELVQYTGDTGAATGALLFVIAHELARIGAVRGTTAAIVLSSDGPERAAIAQELPSRGAAISSAYRRWTPFAASVGVPTTHTLPAGGSHAAALPVPADGAAAQLTRLARSCLEDIGSMGLLLAPGPSEADRDPAPLVQRALDNLDALAALGAPVAETHRLDVEQLIQRYMNEVQHPDKARYFAVAFALSHIRFDTGNAGESPRRRGGRRRQARRGDP